MYTFLESHELSVSYIHNASVVGFSQAEKGTVVLDLVSCRAVGTDETDEKALGGVCGCDGKSKCQCIHRPHIHAHT